MGRAGGLAGWRDPQSQFLGASGCSFLVGLAGRRGEGTRRAVAEPQWTLKDRQAQTQTQTLRLAVKSVIHSVTPVSEGKGSLGKSGSGCSGSTFCFAPP